MRTLTICRPVSLFAPLSVLLPTLAFAEVAMTQVDASSPKAVAGSDALLSGFSWRNIGPNRGGRSLCCAGSPGRKLEYYFGATGGGLWKTTDGGNTWAPMTDGQLTSSSVGAVAVAQTNPDVVYIGMGETQLRGSITQGDGVYRSIDGGKTWRHMGLRETQAISRVRVHPTDPDVVYVAALGHPYGENDERGVFRSKNGGHSWEKVLFVSNGAGAADLIIDPNDPKVIYASIWQVYRKAWKMWGGGKDCGLYKSTDGGDTWFNLTHKPGMPEGPIGKIGITVCPADSDRLWAIVEANEGGVFRSDDAGETWQRTNGDRKLRQRAFYYSRVYADPIDKDVVYCLNTGFYRSNDGGVTFDQRIRTPHGDQHDLWINPNHPNVMVNSNDGGGNVSFNGGATWTEQDYPTSQLYHVMATSDFPYHVAGAQQDNSTVCVPNEGWNHLQARGPNHGHYYSVGGGESGWITQHPTKPDIFYAGSQGALLTRYDRSNGQTRDIQVYPRFFSGEPASALPERWQWTFPIMFSPRDEKIMFTCSQHVWKTTDDGQSWERISPDLTRADPDTLGKTGGLITMDMNGPEIYATVFALAPSFHDVNTIWAGSDDGLMHITRDGGKNWLNITPPDMLKSTRVSIIDESRHAPGTLYVAGNRYQVDDREPYVWRTADYGVSWKKITSGIAKGHFARAVREDPVRGGLLFLATEHGVYFSMDAGDEWQSLQLNLPDTPVRDLVVKDSDVVLGTHGRGFWILDDIEPLRQHTEAISKSAVHLFEPAAAVRRVTSAKFQYLLESDAEKVSIDIFDEHDQVVRSFDSTAPAAAEASSSGRGGRGGSQRPTTRAGLNQFTWDLSYPGAVTFDGMIIWSARPGRGPMAPPGRYQVRLTAMGKTVTSSFYVRMDPRVKGVSEADLGLQFELAMKIRDQTSAANRAVIDIRRVRAELAERTKGLDDTQLDQASKQLVTGITAIEEAIYQVKNRSGQDPLNFPIKLNNRLGYLRKSVERGEARPTAGAHRVLAELSAELSQHLVLLDGLFTLDLTAVNRHLERLGKEPLQAAHGSNGRE